MISKMNFKRVGQKFLTTKPNKIFLWCYIVCIIISILFVLLSFAADRVLRAAGLLEAETLYWEDIVPLEITPTPDGKIFSYSIDPQILLPPKEQLVSTIRLNIDFESDTGELAAYYKSGDEQDFSVQNRVYGYPDDNAILFDLGLKMVSELRIDPASNATAIGVFNSIDINPVRDLVDYFMLNGATIYFVILIPAMIASVICTIKKAMVNDEVSPS